MTDQHSYMDEAEGIRQLNKQRPKHHPDFDKLCRILRVTDSEIDRGTELEDVLRPFVDPATLSYLADQRALRAMEHLGFDITDIAMRAALAAMFVDGWLNGRLTGNEPR